MEKLDSDPRKLVKIRFLDAQLPRKFGILSVSDILALSKIIGTMVEMEANMIPGSSWGT